MALKRKPLKTIKCPVCDKRVRPTNKRQIYCDRTGRCAMKAYRYRVSQKLARLEQLERQLERGAA